MKATGKIDWQAAAMDKAVPGSNNHGFEATSLKTVSRNPQELNGDGSVVLLGERTGTETGSERPSKILSGWTPQTWTSQIRSIRKKTSRSGRSA